MFAMQVFVLFEVLGKEGGCLCDWGPAARNLGVARETWIM